MSQIIQARILKGFRDLLPQSALPREKMLSSIRAVFNQYAYVPIETPALEYAEILLGKGSDETDKQLYRFADQGKRDVALRFDLTVPLARFTAMHIQNLGVPFRRFHIAPVWRAEKPQRGRYREFTQCDFDIIGSTAAFSDAEIVSLIHSIFHSLKIPVRIRINHRQLLAGLLSVSGGAGKETAVLRAIDKLEKMGKDKVSEELGREAQLNSGQIETLFELLALGTGSAGAESLENKEVIGELRKVLSAEPEAIQACTRLEEIFSICGEADIEQSLSLDLRIARGLDYYTGVVFETQACDLPDIGSICSGGRYDNLTGLYSKQVYPGVGASVGLDRTLAALEELGRLSDRSSCAQALLTRVDEQSDGLRLQLAQQLRAAGCSIEVYPDKGKLGSQLKYANRKGIPLAIIAGPEEFRSQRFSLKDLGSGEQFDDMSSNQLSERVLAQVVV